MRENDLKNIVVLKDLPSNIVEEAIIILKTNKMAKKVQKIEKSKSTKKEEPRKKQADYILKEAEMLVSNYADKIENEKNRNEEKDINKKYKRIKKYAYITSIIILIESLVILIK